MACKMQKKQQKPQKGYFYLLPMHFTFELLTCLRNDLYCVEWGVTLLQPTKSGVRLSIPSGCRMLLQCVCCCEPSGQEILNDCCTVGRLVVNSCYIAAVACSGQLRGVQRCRLTYEAVDRLVSDCIFNNKRC